MVSKIQNLIASGKTLKALNQLIEEMQKNAATSNHLIDAINLKNQWSEISRKENLNLISSDDSIIQKAKINHAILEILESIKVTTDNTTSTVSSKSSNSIWMMSVAVVFGLGISIFFIHKFFNSPSESETSNQVATIPTSEIKTTPKGEEKKEHNQDRVLEILKTHDDKLPLLFKKEEAKNKFKDKQKHGKWIEYFDEKWQPIENQKDASYFRLVEYTKGVPVGITRDFFKLGQLQWVGKLTSIMPDKMEGWVKWYYENGNIQKVANYEAGVLQNEMYEFYENGKLQIFHKFKNGKEIQGVVKNRDGKIIYKEIHDLDLIKNGNKNGNFFEVIYDDFSTNNGAWGILKNDQVESKQENRKFIVETQNNKMIWHLFKKKKYFIKETDDFLIEIKTNWFGGNIDKGYGITWGGKDTENHHAFYINSQNEFAVFNVMGGNFSGKFEKTNKIQKNSLNKLGIKKVNNQYQFLINDEVVKTMPFSDFYGQSIGVVVTGNQKVAYDDFSISYFIK